MTSVSASAPRIGFDRFLPLNWVTTAMQVRAGTATPEDLARVLDHAELTPAVRKKTMTLLNRLWLDPRPELAGFCDRGIAAWSASREVNPAAMAWGITIAAYPFFAKVAELVGRLNLLHGDCRATEVHRRMEEVFGQREGTRRMTNMALQTQENWGAVARLERGQRIVRAQAIRVRDDKVAAWLIEAALRYAGRAVPAASVGSMAVLYPFELERPLAMVMSQAEGIVLRYDGPGEQLVDLKTQR